MIIIIFSVPTRVTMDVPLYLSWATAFKPIGCIGMNLNSINDWSTELPLQDAFKSARPWITQNIHQWDTQEEGKLHLDASGWVKSLPTPQEKTNYTYVGTLIYSGIPNREYPEGVYVVSYEGEGTIEYKFDAVLDKVNSTPGKHLLTVKPSEAGIYLQITATDPYNTGNYIRNIKIKQQVAQEGKFNPELLKKLRQFKALRFMDWMQTNNSKIKQWGDRSTPHNATFALKGVPVEVMVELANLTNTNPWFNMPHQASDEYVRKFAQYVQQNLKLTLTIYVEYSNEVWNSQFEQHHWVETQAKQAGFIGYGVDWYSKRTTEILRIWDEVFGKQKSRVIGVMAAQAGNAWIAQRALEYQWDKQKKTHTQYGVDAITISPYFGHYIGSPDNQQQVQHWQLAELFKEIEQGGLLPKTPVGGALQETYKQIEAHAQLAKKEDLQLIAYEGGQHLVGYWGVENNQAITNLFMAANRDNRMNKIYKSFIQQWFNLGGGLFMHFSDASSYGKFGSWGSLENIYHHESPKYNALKELSQHRREKSCLK